MRYERFIGVLEQNQTARVKAISFPESCSLTKIPEGFLALLPEVIKILESKITRLCGFNQVIAIFGLQVAPIAIKSPLPLAEGRISNPSNPYQHLCVSLSYLVGCPQELSKVKSWAGAENIVIDFTSGEVMSAKYYMSKLFKDAGARVNLYGQISTSILEKVWNSFGLKVAA